MGRGAMSWIYLPIALAVVCVVMTSYNLVQYFRYERKRKVLLARMAHNNNIMRQVFLSNIKGKESDDNEREDN